MLQTGVEWDSLLSYQPLLDMNNTYAYDEFEHLNQEPSSDIALSKNNLNLSFKLFIFVKPTQSLHLIVVNWAS